MEGKQNARVRSLRLTKQGLSTVARSLSVILVLAAVGFSLFLVMVPGLRSTPPTLVTMNSGSCILPNGSSKNTTCVFSFFNPFQRRITVDSLNITKDSSLSIKIVGLNYPNLSLPSSGVQNFTVSFLIPELDNVTSGQNLWFSVKFNTGESIVASIPIS